MTDLPVITRVLTREDGRTVQWPALVFLHCETETGPVMLRMTGEAARDLRGLFEKLPPKIGRRPDTANALIDAFHDLHGIKPQRGRGRHDANGAVIRCYFVSAWAH
ncbi:MAG: hypothetical protein WCD83_25915 [Pseudolabrys sp.]